MNKSQNQYFTALVCIVLFTIIISSCTSSISNTTSPDSISVTDFPNTLNLKGLPDSAADRSVFAFSDLGAWHGYALHPKEDKTFTGSFIGPFIMTQDNGIWLSQSLSKMEIINQSNEQILNLSEAEIVESNSYPHCLQQILNIQNPTLSIQSQLIFISNRSALIKVSIQNKSKNADVELAIRWSGKSFLEEVSFSEHPQGVLIDFGKNKNIGWISAHPKNGSGNKIDAKKYSIQTPDKILKPNETWETYLSQTFCFSEHERIEEEQKLEEIFLNPNEVFQKNKTRWNQNLENIISQLHPEFRSNAHQKIAVKCLQTLNNNWRSPAGFLIHDGLFPSYNYQWFNGFWSWDSWKHAVAIALYDTKLAQNQIRAMYDFQDEMGMIADCVYRDTIIENHNWRDTKPPLSAWAIWEVYQKSKDKDFLKELFPKVEKYHNWWYEYRDINQNKLCEYGSTDGSLIAAKWESGMDNAVRFDEVKILKNNLLGGSINCESVDLNAYLFAEKEFLSKIAKVLGEHEKSKQYHAEAATLKEDIHEKFYNTKLGWYFDFNLETQSHLKIFGPEGWTPLWVNLATPEQAGRIRETMIDTTKFATYIPFPTLAADHPKFKPNGGYWRGPVWLDQAYFAIQGLRNYGYEKEAIQFSHHLFDRLEGLKNTNLPIRENYHPHTGKGLESNHFSWSAAHLLMLLVGE